MFNFLDISFTSPAPFTESIVNVISFFIRLLNISSFIYGVSNNIFSFIFFLKLMASVDDATAKLFIPLSISTLVNSFTPRPYALPFTTAKIV